MADIEQTRAVVESDETFDGRIFPTERAEIDRPVRLNEGATVEGSIYGATVETSADATVEGSVMASDAVDLEGGRVRGEVGTPGKVTGVDSRIDGTVTGQRIRLVNCVVRGNVVGANVILEDCVVLGIATADSELVLENSLCYTFKSRGTTELSEATIVLPQAIADGSIDLRTPLSVAGLGKLDVAEDDDRLPEMGEDDRYEQNGTTYLTLAPRVLNLEEVTDRLAELEDGIMTVVDDTSGDDDTDMTVEDVLELLDVEYDAAAN